MKPPTVREYLSHWAPKGEFFDYWIDKDGNYNVLVICQQDGEYRFNVDAFPQVVGHWGHQLMGGTYTTKDMQYHLEHGLWEAGDHIKERLRAFLATIEKVE